eukprot:1161008-Pelagomonas_calceolata.AAC.3
MENTRKRWHSHRIHGENEGHREQQHHPFLRQCIGLGLIEPVWDSRGGRAKPDTSKQKPTLHLNVMHH